MYRLYLRYALLTASTFLIFHYHSIAQTITSTPAGGSWTDAGTWIGGVLPTQNNDVVIDGTVAVTASSTCRNITVNGTLEAVSWPAASLTVSGNIVNNGLIRDFEGYYWNTLSITVTGGLTNNGIIRNGRTYFKGTSNHQLSLGADKVFETVFASVDTLSSYTALSSLYFKAGFNLKGAALNMQSYPLTLEGAGNIYNGSVTNTGDLTGRSGASLTNITYKGNINIKKIVTISSNVIFEGTVTVTDTIEAISWPAATLTITGNLVNNGLIRDFEGYYWNILLLTVTGNLTNNGTFRNGRTYFKTTADHKLSLGTGKVFQTRFASLDTLASFTAVAPLYFMETFDLKGGILNMQTNPMTLYGAGNVFAGTVLNTGDLIGKQDATLSNVTYKGAMTLKSIVLVASNVVFDGTVTVKDTLQVTPSGAASGITIKGDVINNGLIRNFEGYYWQPLSLFISGNITNNGIWRNTINTLTGTTVQSMSLGAGKVFETNFAEKDTLRSIAAGTALYFMGTINLKGATLNMQSNALTLYGAGNIFAGSVINTGDIAGKQDATLSNITYKGAMTLKNIVLVGSNVIFEGTVTVKDTLQVTPSGSATGITIKGDLINNGLVRNFEGYYWQALTLNVTGTVTNNGTMRNSTNNIAGTLVNNGVINSNMVASGDISSSVKWDNGTIYLAGTGERTILGNNITCPIHSSGEKVTITGDSYLNNLTIDPKSVCIVASGSTVYVPENNLDELLDNRGTITTKYKFSTATDYAFFRSRIKVVSTNTIDSIKILSVGRQVPESFANAVKCYWRIFTYSKTFYKSFSALTLIYDRELLGNSTEAALQVFNSQDSGKTWVQLSTSLNTTRDLANHTISITDAPSSGDYLLSSSADPVSVRPCIITAIIGRTAIRIGAPNRFTIFFVNNSDFPSEDFLMSVNAGSKVHISSAEIPLTDGGKAILTKDSLFYDATDDTSAFFYVMKMAPREERSFDIIVVGDVPSPKVASLNKAAFVDPVSLTAAAVITWAAWKAGTFVVTKAIDYIGDKIDESIKLTPDKQKRYDTMVKGGIPTELDQQPGKAKVFAGKFVGGMIAKKILNLAPAGASAMQIAEATTANIKKVAPSLRQRVFNWFYKESGLYGVEETESGNTYQPAVSTATLKKGELVRSCDPNEKVGPEGYGDRKFITSAGKMMYQILFENKKEATAPAYKIVVVDTLQPEFDPETAEFGKTSHDAPQYTWKKTRTGSILRWEIEGIELPPNVNIPEGEGWVAFTVSPKSGLASGTALTNSATITFDMNPAIRTNIYQNVLDYQPPVTLMKPLTQNATGKSITDRWQTSDDANGSGVESATLYASIDGGGYADVGTTTADSLLVPVAQGTHRYSFYSLAKDYLGNVEASRPAVTSTQTVNGVATLDILPENFSLSQNFPNPFNPTTTIQFSLASRVRAELKIYDMLGRELTTLVDEERAAGRFSVVWNAAGASSGMYIYRLKAGNFVQMRKLILLK